MHRGDGNARLGVDKPQLVERFTKIAEEEAVPQIQRDPLQLFRSAFRALARLLIEMGIPYPLTFTIPPPLRINFTKQAVRQLGPGESDTHTFKARDDGLLILDEIEVSAEDALAYEKIKVEFFDGPRENSIDYSETQASEAGFWKFFKRIVQSKRVWKIKITNTDDFGSIVYALWVKGWEL